MNSKNKKLQTTPDPDNNKMNFAVYYYNWNRFIIYVIELDSTYYLNKITIFCEYKLHLFCKYLGISVVNWLHKLKWTELN